MPRFDHALIVTIEANTYEDSLRQLSELAAGIGDSEQIACSDATYEHDNDGQRVVYLSASGE